MSEISTVTISLEEYKRFLDLEKAFDDKLPKVYKKYACSKNRCDDVFIHEDVPLLETINSLKAEYKRGIESFNKDKHELQDEIYKLKNRGFWSRVFNR